jgi:hypothetical protein
MTPVKSFFIYVHISRNIPYMDLVVQLSLVDLVVLLFT